MERARIVVIGAGNVATHIAKALDAVCDVVGVYARHKANALQLANSLREAVAYDDIKSIATDADYYLISVNDDAISDVAAQMPKVKGIVMHTSGSVGIEAIDVCGAPTGVFYPLQTFSKAVAVDVSEVPFFIEASDSASLSKIESLAHKISGSVHYADSRQRTVLHIAAVFGCNFVNHLLDISSQILSENGYTLEVLHPLLKVTLDKAMTVGAHNAQTGPAARRDIGVIEKHIKALGSDRAKVYSLLSESIMRGRDDGDAK